MVWFGLQYLSWLLHVQLDLLLVVEDFVPFALVLLGHRPLDADRSDIHVDDVVIGVRKRGGTGDTEPLAPLQSLIPLDLACDSYGLSVRSGKKRYFPAGISLPNGVGRWFTRPIIEP